MSWVIAFVVVLAKEALNNAELLKNTWMTEPQYVVVWNVRKRKGATVSCCQQKICYKVKNAIKLYFILQPSKFVKIGCMSTKFFSGLY